MVKKEHDSISCLPEHLVPHSTLLSTRKPLPMDLRLRLRVWEWGGGVYSRKN